jgi:Tol biopolymer transport system component/DNA-binding winged helix-turn-helix (wHTH) protein
MHDVPRYAFGDYQLDTGRVQLVRDGEPVPLEPKAFAVLQLLVEHAPHVVDKAELFAQVWKDTAVTDNALTRIVAQLRKALGDDARDPRYIATVSARGYRLLPPVREAGPEAAERTQGEAPERRIPGESPATLPAPVAPSVVEGVRTPDPRTDRRPLLLAGAAALVAFLGAALWFALRQPTSAAAPARSVGDLDLAVAASLRPEQMTIGTGFDGYVAFSPDGTSIAYSSDRSGRLEIYVEGLAEGSAATSLTRGAGQGIQPAWSPDGRFIAYHDLAGNGIWVVPSRGGTARKIADVGAHPTWSPDGTRIAFQSIQPADLNPGGSFGAESRLWIADVAGRTPPTPLTAPGRPLGSHGMPQWWPGSHRVVFAVSAPSGVFLGAALWTVDVRTGAFEPLSAHERISSEFTVAPDGRGVLVVGRNTTTLWWLPVDDFFRAGEPRPTGLSVAGTSLASVAMSPDGRRIAWTAFASNSGIWAAAAGTSRQAEATPIVPPEDIGWRAGHPAVAPDGRIAFVGNRGNAGNKVFLVEPGRSPRQLTTDARDHHSPFWVMSEQAIATLANHGDGMGWWLIDPATGRERFAFALADVKRPAGVTSHVIGPSAGMSISPDFTHLAIAYIRDGVPNLWTADLGPRGPVGPFVQRTFEAQNGAFASWSPDGRWLAYQCTRDGSVQLCLIDATVQPPAPVRQLTRDAGTNFNGEWIDNEALLVAGKRAAVWNVLRISRSGPVTPLTAFVEPRFYVRYPRWDPAGQRVVFERYETTGRLWSVQLPAFSGAGSPGSGPGH